MTIDELDLDELLLIANATSGLEGAEEALWEQVSQVSAGRLGKLLKDTRVQIDRKINGYDGNEPAPDPQTAALRAAFEPVTRQRLAVLDIAKSKLHGTPFESRLDSLLKALSYPSPSL